MKILKIQKIPKILIDLKFSILILALIAFASSFGSFIEQDEPRSFYEENYPIEKPIYGFVTSKIILNLGFDHVYNTWWFLLLLFILGLSLSALHWCRCRSWCRCWWTTCPSGRTWTNTRSSSRRSTSCTVQVALSSFVNLYFIIWHASYNITKACLFFL